MGKTSWSDFLPNNLTSQEYQQQLVVAGGHQTSQRLADEIPVVSCKVCHKQLLESALIKHLNICGKPIKQQKRKDPETIQPPPIVKKKMKEEKEVKKKKVQPPINLDTQCGAPLELGGICARAISCKVHSVAVKRRVEGRSTNYDILYQEHLTKYNLLKKSKYSTNKDSQKDKVPLKSIPELFASQEEVINMILVIQNHQPKPAAQAKRFMAGEWIRLKNNQALLEIFQK